MWEGCYGKEPFDLRLTALRLLGDSYKIAAAVILGTLLFGGGYYVKNVLLYRDHVYEATSVYRVAYTEEPTQSGDYYINEMTWNTYVHSEEFYRAFYAHLLETEFVRSLDSDWLLRDLEARWEEVLEAKLASDWHVPSTVVTTSSRGFSEAVALAVEQTMTRDFADGNPQVAEITVIDRGDEAREVFPDVRPLRAVILSAVLSLFFALTIWLLGEIGSDGIWLPATLRRRYGLAAVGTLESGELVWNLEYRFAGASRIMVCPVGNDLNTLELCRRIEERAGGTRLTGKQWFPMPDPLLIGGSCALLRGAEGVLLAVRAGSHEGKPLERTLEFLAQQEITVTAAILWEADEGLLRAYYRMGRHETAEGSL